MATLDTRRNRLMHINLSVQAQNTRISSIMMRERPFIGELNLDIDPDNLSLLIAVGEVMNVAQPLTVSRISCVDTLAILWLDQNRWLVLPSPGSQQTVIEALQHAFGPDLRLDTDENRVQVQLSGAAIETLLTSDTDTGEDSIKRLQQEGVIIMQPGAQREYDILVRDHCAERLWHWMGQHPQGSEASLGVANG